MTYCAKCERDFRLALSIQCALELANKLTGGTATSEQVAELVAVIYGGPPYPEPPRKAPSMARPRKTLSEFAPDAKPLQP